MFSSYTVLSLALSFSASVDAFWRMNCGIVQTGRIDPIISPGQIASHVHKIAGGSNINLNSTFEDMRASTCTSCEIQADRSGYWTPQLYYEHANGEFEEVPNNGMVVYYLGRGINRQNIQPFPPGLKMLSGNALARSYDNVTMTWGNATNPPEILANRVSFNCLDESGPMPQQPYMFRTNCSDGLRAQIQFQSCWDGVNLYKSDQSHVAYMSQIDNGACPPTHPVQLVHLFFEVLYGVNDVDQSDGGRFVFANGDPTGYGFHGDFLNGWDPTVLGPALANCANPDNNGLISACPQLAVSDVSTYSAICPQYAPSGIPIINETVLGNIGNKLPGCIEITDGPAAADISTIVCPAGAPEPELAELPEQSPINLTLALPPPGSPAGLPGWNFVGQYFDNSSTRLLSGATTQNKNVTIEYCQNYCYNKGLRFAGVEYGSQCWCSSDIPSWAIQTSSINYIPCAANSSEPCGGSNSVMQVYNYTLSTATLAAPGAGPTSAAAGIYYGCAQEGTSGRALSGASTTSNNMTLETCRAFCDSKGYFFSGTEYSTQCYCGNSFSNGGGMLSSNSSCNMYCGGDNFETCGGGNRLSVFNSTTLTIASILAAMPTIPQTIPEQGDVTGASWQYYACIVDIASNSPTRSLTGPSYTDGTGMTLENCAAFAQSKGQQFFGIEYASQCFTGNSVGGLSAAKTDCSMPCTGNKTELCGGGWRLSTYVNVADGQSPPAAPSMTAAKTTSVAVVSTSSTIKVSTSSSLAIMSTSSSSSLSPRTSSSTFITKTTSIKTTSTKSTSNSPKAGKGGKAAKSTSTSTSNNKPANHAVKTSSSTIAKTTSSSLKMANHAVVTTSSASASTSTSVKQGGPKAKATKGAKARFAKNEKAKAASNEKKSLEKRQSVSGWNALLCSWGFTSYCAPTTSTTTTPTTTTISSTPTSTTSSSTTSTTATSTTTTAAAASTSTGVVGSVVNTITSPYGNLTPTFGNTLGGWSSSVNSWVCNWGPGWLPMKADCLKR